MPAKVEGRHIHITGIVQGVGFRPFVYELATRYQLGGWVLNNSSGVEIEVIGPAEKLEAFITALQTEPPPLAVIDSIHTEEISDQLLITNYQYPIPRGHYEGTSLPIITFGQLPTFQIRHSESQSNAFTPISPDICICDDCLQELFDPADRRYGYPFINCTNCGPRFTIIRDIPYDRPMTTMADFPMCPDCQREYEDPLNRRFHAQPNACSVCGPQIQLTISTYGNSTKDFKAVMDNEAIRKAQEILMGGGIVAVKGLGGFHLACDAANDEALQILRQRKGRVDKPFAVMALDIAAVETFAEVNEQERALLTSKERPIVLLKKRCDAPLSEWVAPGNQYVGVMLPYTPLHYLLLTPANGEYANGEWRMANDRGQMTNEESSTLQSKIVNPKSTFGQNRKSKILVMTSGNFSEEPIVKDNAEALERLAPLADAFLLHNRDIHIHCDDSVVRVFQGRELPVRRSRGYAPFPIKLPFPVEEILAVGGELKNTFCLTKDNYAFMSQHIGDMENFETLQAFERSIAHFQALFRVKPKTIACDMHPAYLSTKWAHEWANGERANGEWRMANDRGQMANDESSTLQSQIVNPHSPGRTAPGKSKIQNPKSKIEVQHHHAHIASVMAEHGLDGAEPVIGFSFDGTGYGLDGAIWGGELLITNYQGFTRVAHLKYIPLPGGDAAIKRPYRAALAHLWAAGVEWNEALPPAVTCSPVEQGVIRRQIETGFNTVPTSSMGRLFDAVASLVGIRQTVTYEAQAAIEFEAIMAGGIEERYEFGLSLDVSLKQDWPVEIDAGPVIRAVAADVRAGVSGPVISAKFHNAVADLVVQLSLWLREKKGINKVALSGGVFQNVTLLELMVDRLDKENFEILTHRLVPPNDGGLALGQAIISSQRSDISSQ